MLGHLLLLLVATFFFKQVQADEVTVTPTATVTTTEYYNLEIFKTAYVYPNSAGDLTTTTVIGSTISHLVTGPSSAPSSTTVLVTTTAEPPSLTSGASSLPSSEVIATSTQPENPALTDLPASLGCSSLAVSGAFETGSYYSTAYVTTTTTISGSPVAVEYTVLYTDAC